MSATSTEGFLSSLIMYTDTNLSPGWKQKVVNRLKGSRYDVYIFSPTKKRFRSRPQLQEYLDNNTQLGLNIDQFSFSLTKDKNGPRHGLTKLMRSFTCITDQELPNQKDTSNDEELELKEISSKLQPLSSKISALNLTIPPPPPPPTTQLVINIHPQQQWIIQVLDHPAINHEDIICNDKDITSNDENANLNKNMKSFVNKIALQTLLPLLTKIMIILVSDPIYMETDGRELTELEELDLYYDFEYRRERNEKETLNIRSVFDDDSDEDIWEDVVIIAVLSYV